MHDTLEGGGSLIWKLSSNDLLAWHESQASLYQNPIGDMMIVTTFHVKNMMAVAIPFHCENNIPARVTYSL